MAGHFVRELKLILESVGVIEGIDYEDAPFDLRLRNKDQHPLGFHNAERAMYAEQVWNLHASLGLSLF